MLLDTPDRQVIGHGIYSNSSSDKYRGHHHYHPYRRSDRGYVPDKFMKENPPTFDREKKKSQDVEVWLLGMNKLFRLHDYLENMKTIIVVFNLKGKLDIWWEDVNNVKVIHEEELTWSEFERIFRNKYLSKRYYDDREK